MSGADEELALRVLTDDLDEALERHEAGDQWLDLNSITSSFQGLHDVFGVMSDPTAVAARLRTIHEPLSQWRATLTQGLDRGVVVARRQVLAAIEQGRAWSAPEGFAEVAHLEDCAEAAALARQAYGEASDWLEREYLPHAAERDAVGTERYLREARSHLGAVIEPSETYAWGWSEVHRLKGELADACSSVAPDEHVRARDGAAANGPLTLHVERRGVPEPDAGAAVDRPRAAGRDTLLGG